MKKLAVACLVYLAVAGCGGQQAGTVPIPKNRDLISYAEIQSSRLPGWSTYDLIARLRPSFLRSHSAQTLSDRDPVFASVYVDEIFHGDLETLKVFSVDQVESVQFLGPYDAGVRFGTEMPGGAIMIRTRRAPIGS